MSKKFGVGSKNRTGVGKPGDQIIPTRMRTRLKPLKKSLKGIANMRVIFSDTMRYGLINNPWRNWGPVGESLNRGTCGRRLMLSQGNWMSVCYRRWTVGYCLRWSQKHHKSGVHAMILNMLRMASTPYNRMRGRLLIADANVWIKNDNLPLSLSADLIHLHSAY